MAGLGAAPCCGEVLRSGAHPALLPPSQYTVEVPGITIMRQSNRFFFCGHTSGKVTPAPSYLAALLMLGFPLGYPGVGAQLFPEPEGLPSSSTQHPRLTLPGLPA